MGCCEVEFSKYVVNVFFVIKIFFMNEMVGLCVFIGVDIEDVCCGMGSDKCIGIYFIYVGCGYGGLCFFKDVCVLICSVE